eukprot:SRR837773.18173.p1 GENE.SRR837773.18173~~SRR837773.18173.p1  ORF type:complete len:376 (+),score=152.72 SRR837773.18173:120-1130(+)
MAARYALQHPELKVLCMDMTEEGDLTKRLLGGVDRAREKVQELYGRIFSLLETAKEEASRYAIMRFIRGSALDVTDHCIRVADHNENIPGNLYLISSGAYPTEDEAPWSREEREAVAQQIRGSLERSSSTWKLFCDTDGDRRPSPYTMLAYSLCELAVVPLQSSKSDMDRTETMFGVLNQLRKEGLIKTQILMVVWNMVSVIKNEPSTCGDLQLPFTPTKINADIISACSRRVYELAMDPDCEGLFLRAGPGVTEADFYRTSITAVRQFADNAQRPAEELGLPFAQMLAQLGGKKTMVFDSTGVKYQVDSGVLESADQALEVLTQKFEAMSLEAGR